MFEIEMDERPAASIKVVGCGGGGGNAESVPFDTIRHFGMQSGRDADKFDGFAAVKRSHNGLLYITEHTNALISCEVKETLDLGSHVMFIGEVTESKVLDKADSCTYAHYQKAIKP